MSTKSHPVSYMETIVDYYSNGENFYQAVSSYDKYSNLVYSSTYNQYLTDTFTTVTSSYSYDKRGNLVDDRVEKDLDGDGSLDTIDTTHYSYDRNLQTGYFFTNDNNGDGQPNYILTAEFGYDKNGNKVKEVYYQDLDASGDSIEATSITTYEYDKKGNLVTEFNTFEQDENKDGIIEYATSRLTLKEYDKRNNLLSIVTEDDFNGDDVVDLTYRETYSYDRKGSILTFERFDSSMPYRTGYNEYDSKGNLIFSYMQRQNEYWLSQEYEYDKKGNLVEKIRKENDSISTGDPLTITSNFYHYDKNDNLVREDIKYEFPGLENPEEYATNSVVLYDYDRWGNLVSRITDGDADGNPNAFEYFEYDRRGNALSEIVKLDHDSDGKIDQVDTKIFSYDKKGVLVSEVQDFFTDGNIDYEYIKEELSKELFVSYDFPEDFPVLV